MSDRRKGFIIALLAVLCLPMTVSANVVWPSIYIAEGMRSIYVILGGLAIELLFIKLIAKKTWLKAGLMSVVMNAISTLAGIILIPYIGFFGTILFEVVADAIPFLKGVTTFSDVLWLWSYILTVFINVFIEGLSLRLIFKIDFWKNFWWLFIANAISVIICVLQYGFTLSNIR